MRPGVLVAGATGTIGKAVCKALLSIGAPVIVGYHTNMTGAIRLMDELRKIIANQSPECWAIRASIDVLQFESIIDVIDTVKDAGTHLRGLVNCVGINRPCDFDKATEKDWHEIMAVNVTGAAMLCAVAVDHMREHGGSIINIGSVSATLGGPRTPHYAASKAALESLTRNIALFGGRYNIRANVVAPGYIESPMAEGADSPAVREAIAKIPLGRLGKPEEIAHLVAFLASDAGTYITGQVFHVNGGLAW